MPVRNALDALALRPTVFLRSAWPWRSLLYLTGGALLGITTMLAVVGLLLAGAALSVVIVGVAGYAAVMLSSTATRCPTRTARRPPLGCAPGSAPGSVSRPPGASSATR